MQRILKAVLEARAPTPAPALAPVPVPVVSKVSREKLKARSPDVYRGKSHMDYYNFCQQCEDYFATAGATGPTQIPFAASFLRDRISFRWQQYKRRHDADTPVPVTWDEFKAFLRRSLGDSQAFVDAYWGKIKRDSQYQLEEVLDWTAHLEHLQAVLREFDPATAPNKEIMIRYFREGLRPSIQAQLDARGRDLDSWKEAVKKAVKAEAKASLQSPASTCNMDSRCFWGNKPAKREKKDSKNKFTDSTPANTSSEKLSSSIQQTSSPHPKRGGPWRGRRRGQDSPATGVNATLKKKKVDLSQVDYFHCRKKGHYANKYPQKKKKPESKN